FHWNKLLYLSRQGLFTENSPQINDLVTLNRLHKIPFFNRSTFPLALIATNRETTARHLRAASRVHVKIER
ncbi:hypothetical protein, partial [Sphingobacterium multivorum]|uniref:hypothetical protein n=1 Tax=Sphingobacterium multivorum TaxID=28454 RepID=UPI0028AD69D2